MTVPNKQYDKFREQLLHKPTRPSLSQVGAAKIRIRQHKLLRVIQNRAMKMHDAFEVITKGKRRSPVDFGYVSKNTQGGAPKVIVKVCGDGPDPDVLPKSRTIGFREDDSGGKADLTGDF